MVVRSFVFLVLILSCQNLCADTLKVAFTRDNVDDRNNIWFIEKGFEDAHPNVDLQVVAATSEDYKKNLKGWLDADDGPDVLYWYGGERLKQYARDGKLLELTQFWHQNKFSDYFPETALSVVSSQNSIYALPISAFSWGIYYNQDIFDLYGLAPPQNWAEFLVICQKLKDSGVIPIALGSYEKWTLAAWFDYLDIRLNGIEFHLELIQGRRSFNDPKVAQVFVLWKELFDKAFFLEGHESLKWLQVMPFVYRGTAAMTLMGSFLNSRIPLAITPKIRYFSFPHILPYYASQELMPTDVYMVSAKTQKVDSAHKFLQYMAQPLVQQAVNARVSGLPVHKDANLSDSKLSQQAFDLVSNASKVTQFFDRDSITEFSEPAMRYFSEFSKNRDIDAVISKLENLRIKLKGSH